MDLMSLKTKLGLKLTMVKTTLFPATKILTPLDGGAMSLVIIFFSSNNVNP